MTASFRSFALATQLALAPALSFSDAHHYRLRIERFPLADDQSVDEQVKGWEDALRNGGMEPESARKAAESARPSIEANLRPFEAKGAAWFVNEPEGLRIETFSPAAKEPGKAFAVGTAESLDRSAKTVRNLNGNCIIDPDRNAGLLKAPGDVLFLTGALPRWEQAAWKSYDGTVAAALFQEGDAWQERLEAKLADVRRFLSGTTENGLKPGTRQVYASNGKITSAGPEPGYRLTITRYFQGQKVASDHYEFVRSDAAPYRPL